MSFFKKIGKSIGSAFNKAPSVVSNIFKKGEDIVGKVGSGLSTVGNVLGKVADVGGQILSNPLLEAGASAVFGPEAGVGLGLAGQALGNIKTASQLAHTGSGLAQDLRGASQTARSGNIQGGISQLKGTIERARDVAGTVGPQFM